jgi:hypothetical protein
MTLTFGNTVESNSPCFVGWAAIKLEWQIPSEYFIFNNKFDSTSK